MMKWIVALGVLALLVVGCGSGDPSEEESAGNGSVTFLANQGFVAETGEVLSDGSGIKVDVVAYAHGDWLDLKGGRDKTIYQALNKLNRAVFTGLEEVPCTPPTDDDVSAIFSLVEPGHGFTVRGNVSEGVYKVYVVDVEANGPVTVEYARCE